MAIDLACQSTTVNGNGKSVEKAPRVPLGRVDWDGARSSNERVLLRAPLKNRDRIYRDQFVQIDDPLGKRTGFLGRILAGPFFPPPDKNLNDNGHPDGGESLLVEIEIQGELINGHSYDPQSRPKPGSPVHGLSCDEISDLLGTSGDMVLGTLAGQDDLLFRLQSQNKGVLPRNVGIFGTVGSGKSNTSQVVIEEAAAGGWAVIVIDVEGEYVEMDQPTSDTSLSGRLGHYGRSAIGMDDFHVYHPASCTSERIGSEAFNLRLADFDTSVIAEILQTSVAERNALLDCVEYFEQRSRTKVATSEAEGLRGLLDPTPDAKLPFTLRSLKDRAGERSSRSTEFFDFTGLSAKLMWLLHSGAFDQPSMRSLDSPKMMQPGRVNILDVSVANDIVKNLVTADLLRKVFAYKIARPDSPPTLLVVEEAHSFISKEKVQTMQATLQMLRNVARRGRKRWLSIAFVSQQPGHLPSEIFELCNTRIVHTLRSMHNLEALIATAGDVGREIWARCPLLGPGEAVITSPQLKRPAVVNIRPAGSRRKFVR